MRDAAAFQQDFGAALAGRVGVVDARLARALRVHRNTAAKAAQDALAHNHPVVRALVGDEAFASAAALFADRHPPREPRLCVYGEGFATFLAAYPPFAGLRYLPDLARLERLVIEALFAADADPRDAAAMILDLGAPARLHPAVRVAAFASPAASIWLAHQPEAAPDALARIAWTHEAVLVTRPYAAIRVAAIPPAARAFLTAAAAGASLGAAAAGVGDELPAIFATLITAGTFA